MKAGNFLRQWSISTAAAGWGLALLAAGCHKAPSAAQVAKAQESRRAWNLKTSVDAYESIGSRDPKWDVAATNALIEIERWRSLPATDASVADAVSVVRDNCQAAIQAGCDDPLVTYFYIRYGMDQTNTRIAFADAFVRMATAMNASQYPPVRKFFAAARTLTQLQTAYGDQMTNQPAESMAWHMMTDNLTAVASDPQTPVREATDVGMTALALMWGQAGLNAIKDQVAEPWVARSPNDYSVWLLKGAVHSKLAWDARGSVSSDQVSPEAWKIFGDNLALAQTSLEKAWTLDTTDERVPITMIGVAQGRHLSRDEMEKWFSRAMTIDPKCTEACGDKLLYLYPQWYGSREAMLEFGRECVASTNWSGAVPLTLVDAHSDICGFLPDEAAKSKYWLQPEVWPDIKSAYKRFFELSPEQTGYNFNYAWYAYACHQWDTFLELVPKLGPNHAFFGGEDSFNKMLATAKENVGK